MKKVTVVFIVLLLTVFAFSQTKLVFWTAPNPQQEMFWKEVVAEYEALHPEIDIEWSTIPAAGSSEEAILTAIASGRGPDISTNIFSGFAAQLADIGQLVALNELEGFDELVETRKMGSIIEGWKINDNAYVIPIYSNPILMWWRDSLLKDAGFDNPPRTYSEIYEFSKNFVVPMEQYSIQVIAGRNWWDRWFDFITYYYAAGKGKSYIDTERMRATFNDEIGQEVAQFIKTMFDNQWTAVDLGTDPFYNGAIAGTLMGPWSIAYAENQYPDVIDDIVITTPPVPDNYPSDQPIYTFADTKGLVIFNTTKHLKEAWEFVKWVFSKEDFDSKWLEYTKMPPAREDLLTNEIFADFWKTKPLAAEYAEYVPYAVPPAPITTTVDVQENMTVELIEPLAHGTKDVQKALDDAVKAINRILW
ncbi:MULTISPECIES: extracellular solute-binding protein [Petrotoga]|uniref:Carbohydrate ABC transporter substrate-binding protein (CUT1 family) n=2 Tax=Petrotoga sibirica TaxID=156202 RepID=A0A4R8EM74_9BACT|nr:MULTISPECIES: extracellular solute-binding protein [Petrotoga]POZ88663.1 sugar ABC transporter substrate-binding protein [Petrotoga sibirica DSM 13575]POZ90736.1 sugar ABC transporter substrate-binding protein [Petrotoga sp. SL27]TDX13284.1 carbohydrate ABC transporter substrate-binding protein (CUT1 family) [Petrotoga sibirica]